MPRRASQKISPVWFLVIALVLVIAIGGAVVLGKVFSFLNFSEPFRTTQPLDVAMYLGNANTLRGNIYRVSGTVWSSLGWSPTAGRLFAVEVSDGRTSDLLPLLVPAELNHVNLQKGQRFAFEVEIIEGGVLRVKSLRKE
jgi:hypothetical protein